MRVIDSKGFTTLTHSCGCTKHYHSNCEFVFILNGSATNVVNGHSEQIVEGDIVFINKNSSHSITENAKPYRHRDLYVSVDDLKAICINTFNQDFFDYLISNDDGVRITLTRNHFLEIAETLEELEIFYSLHSDPKLKQHAVSCIKSVIINLLGIIYKRLYCGIVDTKTWITDFIQSIQTPEVFTMKINEIIALSHYSRTYFCNLFKEMYKLSFKDYLHKLKINYAKTLLKSTDKSVAAIAYECGYETQSHFTQFFKKLTGTTPLAYRKSKELSV